jgi:hypothetical protein
MRQAIVGPEHPATRNMSLPGRGEIVCSTLFPDRMLVDIWSAAEKSVLTLPTLGDSHQ